MTRVWSQRRRKQNSEKFKIVNGKFKVKVRTISSLCVIGFGVKRSIEIWNFSTRCGTKLMRLATLCTNRQFCCLPLHMAVRVTPIVDSVQVWTCYSCYAIVESVWSDVVFVRCVTKNGPAKVWAMLCHQMLCKAWRIRYCDLRTIDKELMENIPYPGHKCSDGTSHF